MADQDKILSLCANCSKIVKKIMDSDMPQEVQASLNQNLFILDTAIEQLSAAVSEGFSSEEKSSRGTVPTDLKAAVEAFEMSIIREAIEACGSKRKAAGAMNMDHSTLIKKCQRYGI